jgi:hypothetical protein
MGETHDSASLHTGFLSGREKTGLSVIVGYPALGEADHRAERILGEMKQPADLELGLLLTSDYLSS